jgi:4-amino-4-deoxy-L-arabinose transferase-like glycosyltransferase
MAAIDEQDRPPELSVVVPVFNGESFIAGTIGELSAHLVASGRSAELIVVDDGSTDGSAARAREAAALARIAVRVVSSERNEGKGAAVKRGMRLARGEYRIFIDADLAYPASEIGRIVASLAAGADVAIASRVHEESRYLVRPSFFRYLYTRHVAGRLFNLIVRATLLPGIRDSQAGLKGFRARAAELLFDGWLPAGFSFDLGVLYRARRLGMRTEQVPVFYRYDSEPSTVRFLLDTLIILRDLLRVRTRSGPGRSAAETLPAGGVSRAAAAVLEPRTARAILVGIIGVALIVLLVARLFAPNGALAVTSWLVILAAALAMAWRSDRARGLRTAGFGIGGREALFVAALLLVGALLRLASLADLPPMVHGDTAECGLRGLEILRGDVPDVFDFSPWYQTCYLSFVPYAASFAAWGLSLFALRLPSAILGIGCIVLFYLLARVWFGARVAFIAGVLFATSHAAIHFSRIGLWNIQTLFYALAAFAALAVGARRGGALAGMAAGIFSGLALYSYTAGRLIPLVILTFLLTQLARRETLRFAGFFAAGIVLTAVPLVLNYVKDPSVLELDRTASVWVLAEENRFHVESTLGVRGPAAILQEQVRRTIEGFVTLGDTSSQYGTTQPLLSPLIAVLFLAGLLLGLGSIREPRYLFLTLWLGFGLLLGSVIVIDPPSYTRLIIVLPIPFVLAAVAIERAARFVQERFSLRAAEAAIVYVLILAQAAAFNLVGYRRFMDGMETMPREWDVLRVLERYRGDYDYYLFTGPFLYADSPVLRLFSTGTRAVSAVSEVDLPPRLGRDTAFVVTPEFRRLGLKISEQFPSAERTELSDQGVVKAYVYTCTAANGCRRGAS